MTKRPTPLAVRPTMTRAPDENQAPPPHWNPFGSPEKKGPPDCTSYAMLAPARLKRHHRQRLPIRSKIISLTIRSAQRLPEDVHGCSPGEVLSSDNECSSR